MNAQIKTFSTEGDYKVADISLADFGRKELDIAEPEMPGLVQHLQHPGPCRRRDCQDRHAGVRVEG
jgi:hypothetical protein